MATEIKKKRPPKTLKERKHVALTLKTADPIGAAMEVYDVKDRNSARVIANENLRKLSFEDYFAKAGLTDDIIAKNVSYMALEATKRDHFSGEYEPDYNIRLKSTELAIKVMNKMPKDAPELGSGVINLEINVNGDRSYLMARGSVSESSPLQSLEVRTTGGENLSSPDHNT